jgi:arylsulfatase A-like enzyme
MNLPACVLALLMTTAHAAPNVIMIVSDDQGWRDIGYRYPAIKTPHLDQLASTGIKFEHHYVFATCSPTRCALLTGMNPARFGVLGPIGGESKQSVPITQVNLATLLKSRGYHTSLAGKWHLNLSLDGGPKHYGFDTSYGYLHGQIDPLRHDYKTGKRTWHRNDEFVDEDGHATDLIADEAVRVIQEKREQPFFLYVAFSVPHEPLIEEKRWTDLYADMAEPTRRLVAASISHMDDAIGRMVSALDQTQQRQNTLIIFTSDNGGPQSTDGGDYGGRFKDQVGPHSDNGTLRDWKGSLYDGGILVPAFVNWPGTLVPRVENAVVSAMDWLPSLAALTGSPLEEAASDGRNVWPTIAKGTPAPSRELYWRTNKAMAVREGDWKLIRTKGADDELYNLSTDPNEQTNAIATQGDIAGRLGQKLKAWKAQLPADKK